MREQSAPVVDQREPTGRRLSSAERAYRQLREMIVTGILQPGEVVNEQELVERLGIGRTPVREAIQRLRWQHVLTVFPRRGLAIAKLGLEDVQAIFEAREAVEHKTAELAAIRRTEEDARSLLVLGERVREAEQATEWRAFLEADQDLHRAIAAASRNPLLAESADELLMLSNWIWHRYFMMRGSRPTDYFHHDEITQAIIERDGKRAGEAMAAHVVASRDLVRSGV